MIKAIKSSPVTLFKINTNTKSFPKKSLGENKLEKFP